MLALALPWVVATNDPTHNFIGSAAAQDTQATPPPARSKRSAKRVKKPTAVASPGEQADPYAGGIAAANAGKHDVAIDLLSNAIQGGKLSRRDLARALYLRGGSYKATAKVALAISDLTAALYMSNGLSGEDRKRAVSLRAEAYSEAGLSDQGQGQNESQSQSASSGGSAITAVAPVAAGAGFSTTTRPQSARTSVRPQQPSDVVVQAPTPPLKPWTVAARSNDSPVAAPAARDWARATNIRQTPDPTRRTAAVRAERTPVRADPSQSPAARPPAVSRSFKGQWVVQVAALRSQSMAEGTAAKVRTTLGRTLAKRTASVDQQVVGNMGTFYRVLVGPFAKPGDTGRVCAALRKSGLDCLVVRN